MKLSRRDLLAGVLGAAAVAALEAILPGPILETGQVPKLPELKGLKKNLVAYWPMDGEYPGGMCTNWPTRVLTSEELDRLFNDGHGLPYPDAEWTLMG